MSDGRPYYASVRVRRPAVIGILAILATSCNPTDRTATLAPGESVAPESSECAPVNIVGPSGALVDLTGVWRSNDSGFYDIHQRGSCLYWMGMSNYPGTEPGEFWTNVFIGTVGSDFTIIGQWGDVPFNPSIPSDGLGFGSMTLQIDFVQSGEVERPVLRAVSRTGGFSGSAWVLEESLASVELEGIFGGNADNLLQTGCVWIESNGQRYELIGDGGWLIRIDPPLRVEDETGRVVAREGDPLRIRGPVSEALGTNCVENAILVEELDPTP